MGTLKSINKRILVGLTSIALIIGMFVVFANGASADDNVKKTNLSILAYENNNRSIAGDNLVFRLEDKAGNIVRDNIKTGIAGAALVKDVKPGDYNLVQTKDENGKAVINGQKAAVELVAGENKSIEVGVGAKSLFRMASKSIDNTNLRKLKLVALDSSNDKKALTGVKFALTNTTTGEVQTAVTNNRGVAQIDNLEANRYKVVAVEAATGYELNTIVRDVDLVKSSNATLMTLHKRGESTQTEEKLVLNNVMRTAESIQPLAFGDGNSDVQIIKYYFNESSDPEFIGGAVFELTNKDTSESKLYTTNGQGIINATGLEAGSYNLKEVLAPDGFKINPSEESRDFNLTIDDTAQFEIENLVDNDPSTGGTVTLEKYDAMTALPMAGVEFSLLDENEAVVKSGLLTDSDGMITVDSLPYGVYYWLETKVDSDYRLSTIKCEVESADGSTGECMMPNMLKEANTTIVKEDVKDKTKLPGATFKITGPINTGFSSERERTTGADGTISVGSLIPGEYTLQELSAPTNYKPIVGTFNKTVTRGGAAVTWTIENSKDVSFDVIYNGNGNTSGSVPVDSNSPYLNEDAEVTVLDKASLVKDNWTFTGWNTQANGLGTSYAPGAKFNIAGDMTLYAQWKENAKYTVTYNGNGSTGGTLPVDSNSPYYIGSSVTVLDKGTLAKTNWTFTGWNTAQNGSGDAYAAGDTFNISSNVTLYAQWTEDGKAVLSYNGNGYTSGNVPTSSEVYLNDSVTVAGKGTLARANWDFVEWNTSQSGDGISYQAGDTFALTQNTTLYAQWSEHAKYSVTYDGNGHDSGSAPVDSNASYYVNTNATVLGKGTLALANHTFMGWNTQADGFGTSYAPGATHEVVANVTLYAQWKENDKFTITYDGNGSDAGTVPVDTNNPYYVNSSATVLDQGTLTLANYKFIGWNTNANGSGTMYAAGATIKVTGNITLYAQWEKIDSDSSDIIVDETPDSGIVAPELPETGNDNMMYGAIMLLVVAGSSVGYVINRKKV